MDVFSFSLQFNGISGNVTPTNATHWGERFYRARRACLAVDICHRDSLASTMRMSQQSICRMRTSPVRTASAQSFDVCRWPMASESSCRGATVALIPTRRRRGRFSHEAGPCAFLKDTLCCPTLGWMPSGTNGHPTCQVSSALRHAEVSSRTPVLGTGASWLFGIARCRLIVSVAHGEGADSRETK